MSKLSFSTGPVLYAICQILVILFFGLFTEFKKGADPRSTHEEEHASEILKNHYAHFQDVHIMIFVGFGFLMCFLKSHNWSSIGYNYLLAAWSVQITILWGHFWKQIMKYYDNPNHSFEKLEITVESLLDAEFGAASVLISMGAILGKCSLIQLFGMANINVFFYTLNRYIVFNIFKATDIGESMTIHTFGAYFGVAATWFFRPSVAREDKNGLGKSNYLSDLVSMTGTLFLFVYWPSFNGGPGTGSKQYRAIINTYLSLTSSVIASIIVSRLTKGRKLEMEIILNASLAGGVVMGSNADIISKAYGAMLAGFCAGVVSSLGYAYLGPYLLKKINLHDTCGVHNLHGMPGLIGGITSAIVISRGVGNFGEANYSANFVDLSIRTVHEQAGYQLAALATSLAFGIFGGIVCGLITGNHNPMFEPLPDEHFFDDQWAWDECEIDHRILFNLQIDFQKDQAKQSNFKIISNVANTI